MTTQRTSSFWLRLADVFLGPVKKPDWMTPRLEARLDALVDRSRKPDNVSDWVWLERQPDWHPLVGAHWGIVGSGEWLAAQTGSQPAHPDRPLERDGHPGYCPTCGRIHPGWVACEAEEQP